MRHIRESVFVLILGSVARWSCKLFSNFLPFLKGLRGGGEVSQDSWWDGKKGHTCKHHGMYATFSGWHVLFKNKRSLAVRCSLDSWKHPERKLQEMSEMTGNVEILMAGNLNNWIFHRLALRGSVSKLLHLIWLRLWYKLQDCGKDWSFSSFHSNRVMPTL